MIKLGLENLFAMNTFVNISLHEKLPQSKTLGTESASNQTVDTP